MGFPVCGVHVEVNDLQTSARVSLPLLSSCFSTLASMALQHNSSLLQPIMRLEVFYLLIYLHIHQADFRILIYLRILEAQPCKLIYLYIHETQSGFFTQVLTNEDMLGVVLSDLSQRQAQVEGTERAAEGASVVARVPLNNLADFSTLLRTKTRGLASFNMALSHYEQVDNTGQS